MTVATPLLLTGGTGFLGSHLRERLSAAGHDVELLVRPDSSVDRRENETVRRGDLTEEVDVGDARTVVHLAAQTGVGEAIERPVATWDVNATGTVRLLEAARRGSVDRFVFASTASVYGPPEYLPIDESHPLGAVEPYGASKLGADRMVRAYGKTYDLDAVTLRVFNTFGPGQPEHNVVPTILEQALEGDRIELGNLSPSRDFSYIGDVVDAFETVLRDETVSGVYNVGSGRETTIQELAESVVSLVDGTPEIVSKSERQRDDDVEIPRHVADASKLRSLGWEPEHDVNEGLRKTIEAQRTA